MANGGTISTEEYRRYVQAFRQLGEKFAPVARLLNVDQRTVARAWRKGWPQLGFKPISEVLAAPDVYDEVITKPAQAPQSTAPAIAVPPPIAPPEPESGAASKAVTPPAETIAQAATQQTTTFPGFEAYIAALRQVDAARADALLGELRVIEAARSNATGLHVIASDMLVELRNMIPSVAQQMKNTIDDGLKDSAGGRVGISRFIEMVERLAKVVASTTDAAGKMQQQHRLLVGEPQKIEELRNTGGASNPDGEDERLEQSRLLKQLITAAARRMKATDEYSGEAGAFIMVDSTPAAAEIPAPPGEAVAKDPAPSDKAA